MEKEIEVTKLQEVMSTTAYEFKVPVELSDDYGNTFSGFKKEVINKGDLLRQKQYHEETLALINEKLDKIAGLEE